jgi:hypothetical protein
MPFVTALHLCSVANEERRLEHLRKLFIDIVCDIHPESHSYGNQVLLRQTCKAFLARFKSAVTSEGNLAFMRAYANVMRKMTESLRFQMNVEYGSPERTLETGLFIPDPLDMSRWATPFFRSTHVSFHVSSAKELSISVSLEPGSVIRIRSAFKFHNNIIEIHNVEKYESIPAEHYKEKVSSEPFYEGNMVYTNLRTGLVDDRRFEIEEEFLEKLHLKLWIMDLY